MWPLNRGSTARAKGGTINEISEFPIDFKLRTPVYHSDALVTELQRALDKLKHFTRFYRHASRLYSWE